MRFVKQKTKFKSVKLTEEVYNILVEDTKHYQNNLWNKKNVKGSMSDSILEYKKRLGGIEYE